MERQNGHRRFWLLGDEMKQGTMKCLPIATLIFSRTGVPSNRCVLTQQQNFVTWLEVKFHEKGKEAQQ